MLFFFKLDAIVGTSYEEKMENKTYERDNNHKQVETCQMPGDKVYTRLKWLLFLHLHFCYNIFAGSHYNA